MTAQVRSYAAGRRVKFQEPENTVLGLLLAVPFKVTPFLCHLAIAAASSLQYEVLAEGRRSEGVVWSSSY